MNVKMKKIASLCIMAILLYSITACGRIDTHTGVAEYDGEVSPKLLKEIENSIMSWQQEYYAYAFTLDSWQFTIVQTEHTDDGIVIDIDAQTVMTAVQAPEDSPYVQGARYAISQCDESVDTSRAEGIIQKFISDEKKELNVPYEVGFGYRAVINDDDDVILFIQPDTGRRTGW